MPLRTGSLCLCAAAAALLLSTGAAADEERPRDPALVAAFKHLHSTNTAPQDKSFPPVIINSPVAGKCDTPCNLADARDSSLFPAGMPLSPGTTRPAR